MLVGLAATTVYLIAIFVQSGSLDDVRVDVQLIKVDRDQLASGVVSGAGFDPIACGYGAPFLDLSTEICPQGGPLGSGGLSQSRAMSVGALMTTKVGAISNPGTCHENPIG